MSAQATVTKPQGNGSNAERTRKDYTYRPNVDIVETQEEIVVYGDVPGATTENLDIQFDNGVLTIHARVGERNPSVKGYLYREYGIGDFHRTFEVSEAIDPKGIFAELKNGVLTLHLPKTKEVKPRKIQIMPS